MCLELTNFVNNFVIQSYGRKEIIYISINSCPINMINYKLCCFTRITKQYVVLLACMRMKIKCIAKHYVNLHRNALLISWCNLAPKKVLNIKVQNKTFYRAKIKPLIGVVITLI